MASSRRIQIFVKANADLCDPIYGVQVQDGTQWGGIAAAFRELQWPVTVRVRHETSAGLFSLVQGSAGLPDDVRQFEKSFGTFPPAMQCSEAAFQHASDAVLLSIQADVTAIPALHLASGRRFLLHGERHWPHEAQAWRRTAFARLQPTAPEQAMDDLRQAVERFRQASDAPVLVANMSAAVPGESVHSYIGLPETLSHRIRRFNLALADAAQALDISIVDIDRIVAQGGAERLVIDPIHFTLEGCRRVAFEVARILEDCGVAGAP